MHLERLLPLFPEHSVYVEPFMGGLSVLLNKPRSKVEVVNDLNESLTTFFRVLRDQPDNLIRALTLTPYSRSEYANSTPYELDDDVECARKFYARMKQGFGGIPDDNPSLGKWALPISKKSNSVNRPAGFIKPIDSALSKITDRLHGVAIECKDAIDVITAYNSPKVFYYVDPPYVNSTRVGLNKYTHEMSDSDHERLASVLNSTEGKVMLSGYPSELYEDLYWDWRRIDTRVTAVSNKGVKANSRTDCMWLNY